jgi:lipopolysaccharide transport system ATP-binding protein
MLELQGVGVYYRMGRGIFPWRLPQFWALKDTTFKLYSGETLGIIGRNGAGKSTLLRLLAGILKPDSGTFTNHGYSTSLLTLQVGFVPHLSGRENIVLSGLLLGFSLSEITDKVEEIVDFAEIGDFINEPLITYSSGMRARLGFATSFHLDPDILLVDEVLGVGDASFSKKTRAAMKERMKSHRTVVLVSHSASAVKALCDRAIWIERGTVAAEGNPGAIIEEYLATTRKGGAGRAARLGER